MQKNIEKLLAEIESGLKSDVKKIISEKVIYKKPEVKISPPIKAEIAPPAEDRIKKYAQSMKSNNHTFQQPNPELVDPNIKSLQDKLKFVEQSIARIAVTGPGSGEVNFRYLDDVNRSTLTPTNNNWLLEYDSPTNKVQFTNNVGPLSSILLDTTGPNISQVTGMLSWNLEDDCLDVVQSGGTICQVGLENYSQVYNHTASTLTAGTFVSFTNVYENHIVRMAVAPFVANSTGRVLLTIGVITEDIPPMAMGRATKLGRVNDIDTTGTSVGETWVVGNELWAHPTIPGAMTIERPIAPNNVVFIGLVLKVHPTEGIITVRYNPYSRMRYGSFFCRMVQETVPNTPTEVCFNEILVADGFILDGDNPLGYNEIIVLRRGLYLFSYSIQFTSTNSSTSIIWVWIRKNGLDVDNSTSSWTISANGGRLVATRSYYFTLLEEDYLEVMWSADSANVKIDNPPAVAFAPSTTSVLIDIHQINL